ncbi:MAG: hypothetical protein WKG07_22790 [Hymenobacter sp.]
MGERRTATLYGIYRRAGEIKRLIREIDKVAKVRDQNLNDRVAKRELDGILEHQEALLQHYVLDSLYEPDGNITWFFNGQANPRLPAAGPSTAACPTLPARCTRPRPPTGASWSTAPTYRCRFSRPARTLSGLI